MKCPNCASPLIVLEIEDVEIDHCTTCKGVWLDAGELEILLGAAENRDALMSSLKTQAGDRDRDIRCPICSKPAEIVTYGSEKKVTLDMCPQGHGLWFDDGELHDVIGMGEFPEHNRIYEIIEEIFGDKKKNRST